MWTDKKAIVLNDKNKNSWQVYHEIGEADVFIINPESLRKFFVKKLIIFASTPFTNPKKDI